MSDESGVAPGIGCPCGATATTWVNEENGVSFYCVMCDRRVGRLDNK